MKYKYEFLYDSRQDYLWDEYQDYIARKPMTAYERRLVRNWVKEGQDINALMPYLCAYMGHSDTRCTEYYLRLTSELYPDIVAKCERYYEGAGNEE